MAGLVGVGLGLRWDFLEDVLARLPAAPGDPLARLTFFEVSPENYMRRGGYYPAALEQVREHFPLLAHGLTLSVGGRDPFDAGYLGELRRFLERCSPPFYTDHLCFSGDAGRMLHDLLPLPLTGASARHVAERAREVMGRLERPLSLENITHYLVPGAASLDEPAFIGEVLERSGAGLLLDVNNVIVNAKNYGFDPDAFIAALPLDRVVQLHVAGHEWSADDELFIDSHAASVEDPVLALLERVVAKTGPLPVLLERDHKVPPLDELLTEATKVAAAYDRGIARHHGTRGAAR